jgi:hypothetical protein
MLERSALLLVFVLFFAFLAKDIAVPAVVLAGMAGLRWLGMADVFPRSMRGAGK